MPWYNCFYDWVVCCFGSGFLSSQVYLGRKCLTGTFLQLIVSMSFGISILFLLTDFPCKLTLSAFIDKQISPVMLPMPCFQIQDICLLSCMSEFYDVPRRGLSESLPEFSEAAFSKLSPSIGTIRFLFGLRSLDGDFLVLKLIWEYPNSVDRQ